MHLMTSLILTTVSSIEPHRAVAAGFAIVVCVVAAIITYLSNQWHERASINLATCENIFDI